MYLMQVTAVGYKPKSQLTGLVSDSPSQLMDKASPNLSTASKSASLPGYNNRGFHGAVYNNTSSQATVTSLYGGGGGGGGGANALSSFVNKNQTDKSASKVVATDQQPLAGQKKKKWTGWSGFFRRNSKPSSTQQTAPPVHDDTISSDEETGPAQHHQHQPTSHSRLVGSAVASGGCHQAKPLTSEEASKKRLFLQHPPRTLSKDRSPVVDSLSPLQSDLSASQTSLSRKERRDAILARAQARRNNHGGTSAGGSSSDEQPDKDQVHQHLRAPSPSSYWRCGGHHQSQESLTSNGSASRAGHATRSRTGRTERYLQRRSRDEDSLRREMQQQQQQQQSQSSRHASPSCADWPSTCAQLNPSTSKLPGAPNNQRWLSPVSSSIQGPWGGAAATAAAHHHPETGPSNGVQRVVGESPVTLRKPAYSHNNNNNNSPVVGRAQSALVTHPKLSTPPPPPPRNPLKKSYLLQVQSGDQQQPGQQPGQPGQQQLPLHSSSGRPTSFSFGDLSRFGQQQQQQQQHQLSPGPSSLHDYQNVDQDGRLIPTSNSHALHLPVTSPVQRRVLNSSPQQRQQPGSPSGRHHSAFFPSVSAKSPSPFKSPDQERSKPPPWLASPVSAMKQSAASPCAPPVREFWRSKEVQQQKQTPTSTKSARERLAPFHLTGNNGSVSSLNSDLSSPRSRDPGAQHHNNNSNNAAAISPVGVDCPPFYMATTTGNALNSGNGAAAGTPRRFPLVSNDHNNTNNNQQQQQPHHHVRELSQLKPSTDRHLEQAICELEQIYRSLKLDGDEDLLDRAERRDLPTVHQQLAQLPYSAVSAASVCSGSESGGDPLGGHGITSDLDTMMNWSISGSFENLGSASTTTSTTNTEHQRVRAPPNRRSAVPDKVADDMAVRRLAAAARKSQCNDPQAIAAQSGSYLLLSPSVTAAMATDSQDLDGSGCSRSGSFSPDEPDVIYDDVAYRQIRQANKSLRVAEPQPPFGIPLGPVTPASPSDYLHSSVTAEQMDLRPLLHPTKYPDLVRDDLAFRNLRKDAGQLQLPPGPVNTDKLDDLLQYVPPQQSTTKSLKKKRAIRSLSANIGQLIRMDAARPSGGGGVVDFNRADDDQEEEDERYIGFNPFDSRAQSLSDLLDESAGYPTNNNTYNSNNSSSSSKCAKTPRAVKQRSGLKRVGKSVEPDDVDAIIQRQVRPMASWVERAHLSDVPASSTETITNVTERVPALAKLYPTSALAATRKSEVVAPVQQQQPPDLEMDHLISELSECSVAAPPATAAPPAPGAGRKRQVDSSGLQLALKPPTGAGSFSSEVPGASSTSPAASHCWEESPLFQSTPQFHFTQQQRSASPANSSDSGQVSCCAREVRQILHHQIRQEEKERERLASMASSSSGVASKGRQPTTTTATTTAATTTITATPTSRKSSGGGRKMSNNNETGNGSAPVTAVEKRDERIARYKEERRKQLQAARHQAGSAAAAAGTLGLGHDHSSSSEDLPHEEQSYAKYKHRKQMQKQQLESRAPEEHPPATANVSDLVNCNVSSSGIKRFIKRESPLLASELDNNGVAPVRINRAARLRAAATSATPPPVQDKSVERVKRLSVPLLEMPPIDPSDGQAAGPVVDNGGQPGGVVVVLRQKLPSSSSSSSLQAGSREKDKSTKRKSNLNRALTDEQVLATGQIESQEETGKRIRRRRTAELVAGSAASSAETDISCSIDNSAMMLQRRTESTVQHPPTRQSPQRDPAADLRANLRKTSQPPAFIRPPVPEIHNISESLVTTTPVTADNSASFPAPPPPVSSSSSVPWRTGKVASAEKLPQPPTTATTEPIKTEDLTARIEALTAMAHQTVAKVDRLTGGTPDRELVTNGAHPPPSGGAGSVKAVATKLLNRVANVQPAPSSSPTALPRRPASKIEPPNASVNSNCSPAVKLLPAAAAGSAQQQGKLQQGQQQPQPQSPSLLLSKNRPAVNPIEKTTGASCSPAGVAAVPPSTRANSANASSSSSSSSLARKKSADQSLEKTQNKVAAEPAASGSGGPSSSVKAVQGILKKKVEGGSSAGGAGGAGGGGAAAVVESTSVRIRPEVSAPELYPILRVEEEVVSTPLDPVSILKKRFEEPTELSAVAPVALDGIAEPHSILKRPLSRDGSAESGRSQSPDPINSILKRASLTSSLGLILLPDQAAALSSNNSEPRPILKKRPSTDEPGADGGPRPILKKKSSTEDEHELAAHKPILKSGRRTSQVAEREPEAADQPQEPHPAEGGEEPRQLSIAERISSIESQTNPPSASAAPWRLQSRPVNSVPVNNSASESPISRRKSLDHVIESNRSAGLVEAVNRHVVEAHAHTNSNGTRTSPDILTQPEAEEISQELCDEETKPKENEEEVASASGLDRIRGILRRKSSDNTTEMKSILRSKSPSSSGEQPKSILKRHSPDVNEMERSCSSSSSNSSSEEFPVPAENNLAAQLLNVEMESKNQSIDPAGSVVQPTTEETTVISQTDPAQPTPTTAGKQQQQQQAKPSPAEPSQSSQSLAQSTVRRETETIILESEGSSSGTETTTTVTFRLGGGSAGTTTVKQSQTKIKTNKIAKMDQQETSESSVASRLAALQKSGDTEWRKRISKPVGSPSSPSATTQVDEAATNSDGDIPTTKSSSSIADRLKVLETAQKGWKNRVHEPDAARFTVAGKMAGQQQQRPVSVHVLSSEMIKISAGATDQKIKVPKPVPLRVKAGDGSAVASDSSPSTDDVKPPFNRSTSDPSSTTPSRLIIPGIGKITSRIVSVPRPDDETFTSFFAASSWSLAQSSSTPSVAAVVSSSSFADITDEDFERIAGSRDLVVVEKRSVNVQRRKHNTSRNPIKSLILRPDMLRDEYEEVDTGVAEREVQRMKLEKLAQNSHLAVEALAGLASKEDFAAISLKSAKETGGGGGDQPNNKAGSTYLMQVKGRRQIQTRLVQPTYQSVNSGDCYILVTPTDVIQFIGRYSNVIERSRSTEVAGRIVSKKDLGSARASHVQIVEEDKVGTNSFYGSSKRFWAALGRTEAEQSVAPAGPPEEDELYESAITSTNTVWQLSGDHLEPCEQHWGTILQTEILDPNKVMVFDFGSEMYVWSGKMAPLEVRKRAMRLAKELWDQGYDYSECAINPVFQRHTAAELSKGQQRPDWTLLRSAKQHMEPVLFREKFFDWPDKSGLIRVKNQDSDDNKTAASGGGNDISSLEPYDAQLMLDYELDDPDLELEGAHLGRGVEYYDPAERRLQQISTLSVKVWHLADYEKVLLDQVSRGQFHSRDTYIIRWQYRITVTGKDLKGQPSVHGLLGRDRFCYFIWHGAQAPPTDQGASALKTVELDEERGPHVRVQQGHEPPAFLAIFQGRMTIQSGKRGETDESERWRLYIVRGEVEEEAHLLQVRRCVAALRSRGSLVLVNLSTGTVFLWHGAKSLKHTRQVASAAAAALKEHRPPELNVRTEANLAVKEQYEGAESREFWEGLGHKSRVADRSLYLSLAEKPMENRYDYTARLFHLTSWTGQFRADEVAPSSRLPQLPCPYPFVQEDLYGANQPTLFMLDNEHEVWLWQGWWPDLPDTENSNTGSGKLRLAVERRCAMETVMEYCRLKGDQLDRIPPPAYLVSAGLEPLAFTSLFPYWTGDERVAQLNIQEGRSPGELQPIQDVLERLKRTTYTMSELQVRPPPEGVDPTRLESYLKDDDFQETMGMAKTEFYALPAWRQTQLRKETGLF